MTTRLTSSRRVALRRRSVLALSGAALAMPSLGHAQADGWPNRPIRIILPYGVGGATDVTMRLIAPKLAEILGQPVVIENRVGSGGVVGTNLVARSEPDGYTLVCAALSAVSCGNSRMPRRSSLRVLSSSRCISDAIWRMP